jgi:hypothetical protein
VEGTEAISPGELTMGPSAPLPPLSQDGVLLGGRHGMREAATGMDRWLASSSLHRGHPGIPACPCCLLTHHL